MRNVETSVKKNILTITVDISDKVIKNAPQSKKGRSKLLATTSGFQVIDEDRAVAFNMNVTAKEE